MSRAIRGATARTIHIAPGEVNGHRGGAMAIDLPVANRFPCRLLVFYAIVWAVAAIAPRDWPTWALENLLVVPAVLVLVATHRRFTFSNTSYALITLFFCLHAYGARHGYAHTPAGDWVMRVLHLQRNYFDRVVHCAFGLLLAFPIREIFLRCAGVSRTAAGWLAWAIIVAASAVFEVIESIIAEIVSPGSGPDWLGAQGDEWDAQQDMIMATIGAGVALLITWWRERGPHPPASHLAGPAQPFGTRRRLHTICAVYGIAWFFAAIRPLSRADWLLENLLVFGWLPFLVLTYRRRPLSDRSYFLILIFLLLHAAGAHYTYAEVPLGYWLKDTFGMERNHFDRIVHFAWGLLITYPLRDLMRLGRLRPFWAAFLPAMIIVSWSGFFEIIEAVVAWIVHPDLGQAYLGTQGDTWDAQWDMGLAVVGTAIATACTVVAEKLSRRMIPR